MQPVNCPQHMIMWTRGSAWGVHPVTRFRCPLHKFVSSRAVCWFNRGG